MLIFRAFNDSRENFHQILLNFNILLKFSRINTAIFVRISDLEIFKCSYIKIS